MTWTTIKSWSTCPIRLGARRSHGGCRSTATSVMSTPCGSGARMPKLHSPAPLSIDQSANSSSHTDRREHQRAWPRQPRRPVAHLLDHWRMDPASGRPQGRGVGDLPRGNELVDSSHGWPGPLENEGMPAGWLGWKSARVELSSVDCLQLRSNEQLIGSERQVRKDARPRFEVDEPVCGVRSVDGRPVLATRPWVWLPATSPILPQRGGCGHGASGCADWIVDDSWNAAEDEAAVDPFDDAEEPQLGLFEVVVTGPLGADARFVFFIAEGLWAETSRAIRVPEGDGLTPCSAEIGADELTVSPCGTMEFSSNQIERLVDVSDGFGQSGLPWSRRTRRCVRGDRLAGSWRVAAQLCAAEDVTQDDSSQCALLAWSSRSSRSWAIPATAYRWGRGIGASRVMSSRSVLSSSRTLRACTSRGESSPDFARMTTSLMSPSS